MRLQDIILLEKKKEPKKKIIYVDDGHPQEPFPANTISALEKEIKKAARDLEQDITSPIELVNNTMTENNVPVPAAYLKKKWSQYLALLKVAVSALGAARGYKSNWSTL